MKENANKRYPKLTLTAAILAIINIGTFALFLSAVFINSINFKVALFIEVVVAVVSIVFAVEAKKEKKEGLLIPILVLDIIVIVGTPLPTVLGFIFDSSRKSHEVIKQRIEQEATTDYIKSKIKFSKVRLESEITEKNDFTYYDYEGNIVNKFLLLDFYASDVDSSATYDIEFYKDNHHYAKFSSDYTSLELYAEPNGLYLTDSYKTTKYYSLNKLDAENFKESIEQEIDKQREICLAKREETKSNLNCDKILDIFNKEKEVTAYVYINKTNSNVGTREKTQDPNKIIISCLEEIYNDQIRKADYTNEIHRNPDLYYDCANSLYSILLYEDENLLIFRGRYTCFETTYEENECFLLRTEQTNKLMAVARSLFLEQ